MSQVKEDVKLIVATAKRTGLTLDELNYELAKYKNTAVYMYNVPKDEYVAYVQEVLSTFRY
jgi:glutathione peroxidase-family protein